MPYLSRYRTRRPKQAMGDLPGVLTTGLDLATDPYTQELVCQVQALRNIAHGTAPGVCPEVVDGTPDDAGIRNLVKGLRAYVYAQANPWVYPVAIAAVLGIPFLVGYSMGKDRR